MFGPISGGHFNPVVSFIFFLKKELSLLYLVKYIFVQMGGGIVAVFLVHYIFEISIFQVSTNTRG